MQSRARLLGHPVHPMLIPFPLGLLPTSFIFDIIYLSTGNGRWGDVSFWMMTAGIIGALLAAVFGAADWTAIPKGTRAYRIGLWHGGGNVVVVALFIVSWFLRYDNPAMPSVTAFVLSAIGITIALVTGWLGGELVDRMAVGVDENANLDAPSSIGSGPATRHVPTSSQHLPPRPA